MIQTFKQNIKARMPKIENMSRIFVMFKPINDYTQQDLNIIVESTQSSTLHVFDEVNKVYHYHTGKNNPFNYFKAQFHFSVL